MGKKRAAVIGSDQEEQLKAEKAKKLEQKKLREGKSAKVPGMGGGERVVDTTAESMAEMEEIEKRRQASMATSSESSESTAKAKKVHTRSKAYKAAKAQLPEGKTYPTSDAVQVLHKVSLSKYDPTVELHLVLKKPLEGNKLNLTLPHANGKSRRVAVADDETVAKIEANNIDFDLLVASPSQMGKLVKFAKVLGPRGLMPNPKSGTVSDKPEETAKKLAADQSLTLKQDKSGPVLHLSIGKLSVGDDKLSENIDTVLKSLPNNLKKAVLKSSISPAILLQVS